jgi:hypothetical protein
MCVVERVCVRTSTCERERPENGWTRCLNLEGTQGDLETKKQTSTAQKKKRTRTRTKEQKQSKQILEIKIPKVCIYKKLILLIRNMVKYCLKTGTP